MEQTQETLHKNSQNENREKELLGKLIKRGVLELKPRLSDVGIHYLEAEETLGTDDSNRVKGTLESLKRKGALVAQFLDRVLTCPDCGSPEVFSKYACPKCNSINVDYTELLEHMKCGYLGSRNKFTKGESLVCPECQAELVDDALQYRRIGNCYQCEKCGHRFDSPEVIHFCQQCKRNFTHREAKYIKIYAYKIAEETLKKFSKDLPLFESVREILYEKDFDVDFHAQLAGTSGVQHSFDIIAKKDNLVLVVDISLTGDKNDAVSLLGKKMDVTPTACLLIDMSEGKELLSLGEVYGITILKGGDEKQLKREIRDFLSLLDTMRERAGPVSDWYL